MTGEAPPGRAPAGRRSYPGRDHLYDVLVVGGGFAGGEAAAACARAGLDTLLLTTSLDTVMNLPADEARLEPPPGSFLAEVARAVGREEAGGALRVAAWDLHRAAKQALEATPGLHLLQSSASALLVEEGPAGPEVRGVATWEGVERRARVTALAAGAFLRARLRSGALEERAGRPSEMAYDDLHDDLLARGFAFRDARIAGAGAPGAPAWEVAFRALAEGEVDPRDPTRLPRLGRLRAAGTCARGPLPVEGAAREGLELARALRRDLEAPGARTG